MLLLSVCLVKVLKKCITKIDRDNLFIAINVIVILVNYYICCKILKKTRLVTQSFN